MSLKTRAMQGTAIAVSLVVIGAAAEVAKRADCAAEVLVVSNRAAAETNSVTGRTAGVVASLDQIQNEAFQGLETLSVAHTKADLVTASEENTETVEAYMQDPIPEEQPAEDALSEEELLWENRLLPEVNEFLNVRESADENAPIIGKLYKGDVAEIVETGESWTHIVSGNVDGYVRNDYCVFGQEALAYASENFETEAEILTDGLRIRSEASEDSSIITVVAHGTYLQVDTDAEATEDWVAVIYGGNTRYVSAEFVSTSIALGTGITIEEEQAELRRLEEERAAKAASQVTEVTTIQNDAIAASVDEVTLLAAIIQCEAGSECYEGQVAVGAVVMNRVRSGAYPSAIYDVIYQPNQFPPAGKGYVAKVIANGPMDSCIQAAQEALNGTDNTGGATRFCRASTGHAGVVIGNHVFY